MDDDLYQNAWSETTHTIPATLKATNPPWTPTKLNSSYGEEADLAAPSWSTGTDIRWDEPSRSPGFSWSQAEPDLAWGPSTYEGISFGKALDAEGSASISETADPHSESSEPTSQESHDPGVGAAPSPTLPVELEAEPAWGGNVYKPISLEAVQAGSGSESELDELEPRNEGPVPPARTLSPTGLEPVVGDAADVVPELVAPPSPDGFGSFETGLADETVASPGLALSNAEADPWGSSAWADAQPETEEAAVDEWERAKQEKLKQDRRVPPELLADILRQCEALGRDICPDPKADAAESETWRNDWRSGMDGVPGLTTLLESFLPPLTLQAPMRFSQTQVAKKMATSVKLTKNLPLTKGSPMSHYLSAKGSTAWEISVKEQREIVEDDVPVGWRIVEKASNAPAVDGSKEKKSTGGLFSFWGRRQSQVSPLSTTTTATASRSSSIDKPRSPAIEEVKVEPQRSSQDSVHSSTTSNQPQLSAPPIAAQGASSQNPAVFTATIALTASSYSSAPDPIPERSGTPPAPSAVSRFLGRFSRRNSGMSGSPHSSLALSTDDLEFLSDIVPSASEDTDDHSADALERFVNAQRESLPPALAPPLAPPPKAPTPQPVVGAAISSTSANGTGRVGGNGFADLFGDFGSTSMLASTTPAPPAGTQITIPALPPPLAPSRPITPSATPGAGPQRASVLPGPASRSSSSSRPPSRLQTSTPPVSSFGLPPPPSFKPIAPSNIATRMSRPKLASPFPLPDLPSSQAEPAPSSASTSSSRTSYKTAAEASPTSPTSSLPLGALYPHLVSPVSPPQRSAQPMLSVESLPNGLSSPSGLPTPLASAFSPSPSPLQPPGPSALPPHSSSATSPSTVPLASGLFDNDDFSDFQSQVNPVSVSKASPPIPPPKARTPLSFGATALVDAKAKAPTTSSTLSSFVLPPPPPSSAASVPQLTSFDDDDFADFQASPSSATALRPGSLASSTSSLFPSNVSDQALLTPKKHSGFDDMGDFLSSTLPTPSPPRVPTKSTPSQSSIPPPPSASMPSVSSMSSSSSLLARRNLHAAEHLHTLNLMEKAAARTGRWPAPPSPLPAAIPGPFSGPSKSSEFNLLDDEAPSAAAVLAPSLSLPVMMNPSRPSSGMGGTTVNGFQTQGPVIPASSGSLLQGWDFQSGPPRAPSGAPTAKPANNVQPGGLSAQDLSFFEGL
ncbi:hypothetical protein C8Q79DRAFT_986405 [Trametes meyenii]|nr:hypothetical protein C8Q79DRAFT_986405 [Trametes meyenii]